MKTYRPLHRRVPFHIRKQLEEQLLHDEEIGVIERITGPTPWVSPIVVAPKPKSPGKIRGCVDMRQANKPIPHNSVYAYTIAHACIYCASGNRA